MTSIRYVMLLALAGAALATGCADADPAGQPDAGGGRDAATDLGAGDALPDSADVRDEGANGAPVASAGPDATAAPGEAIDLDGSASSDPDGDTLTFEWRVVSPETAVGVTIADPNAAATTFTATEEGAYVVELVVFDGLALSDPDTVTITVAPPNAVPVAVAGDVLGAQVGAALTLDGTGSFDDDGDELTFAWTVLARGDGGTAELDDATLAQPRIVPDAAGEWQFELVVSDGVASSEPDVVVVQVTDEPVDNRPVARIAGPAEAALDAPLTLDGTASSDADGDELTYEWALLSTPAGATASLDDAAAAAVTFVPDAVGTWQVELVVLAGDQRSDPEVHAVEVLAGGLRPVAAAGADRSVLVGTEVALDGSASADPEGASLTFAWRVASRPAGSVAELVDPATPAPRLTPDRAGSWVLELVVNDGDRASAPDTLTLTVTEPPCLLFSEYVEGTSNNKAVELHNCGTAPLPLDGYVVCLVTNAATTCSTRHALTGTLGAGDVYGICNTGLDAGLVPAGACDVTSGVTGFNGDDRLLLFGEVDGVPGLTGDDELLDAIGDPDVQPPPGTFADVTLLRCALGAGAAFDELNWARDPRPNRFGNFGVAPDFSLGCAAYLPNTPPVADAGLNLVVGVGDVVELDGTGSTDADGDELAYAWTIVTRPAGSVAVLTAADLAVASLVPDVPGVFTLRLAVDDGEDVASDNVTVTAEIRNPPVASAGVAQSVVVGSWVRLDASASIDPDGDALSYAWTVLSAPPGSTAALQGADTVSPAWVPDVAGAWTFQLEVTAAGQADTDTVVVTAAPVSCLLLSEYIEGSSNNKALELHNCGGASQVLDGLRVCVVTNENATCTGSVTLSGSLAPGDVWTLCSAAADPLVVAPERCDQRASAINFNGDDRVVVFVNGDASNALDPVVDVVVDAFGETGVQPAVSPWQNTTLRRCGPAAYSGVGPFAQADLWLSAPFDDFSDLGVAPDLSGCPLPPDNEPPVADAGADMETLIDQPVLLSALASTDPDDDPLTFRWQVVDAPVGAGWAFGGVDAAETTFVADTAGIYELEVEVFDGLASGFDTVFVTVLRPNAVPVAALGPDRGVVRGARITFTASDSTDADGDALSFTWSIVERPDGATAVVSPSGTRNVSASLVPDVAGTWRLRVEASDGRASASDDLTLTVQDVGCLTFSEYVEGSSFNKAYEVHNCSGSPQVLDGLNVCLIVNDESVCSQVLELTGTLAGGDVLTVCNANAALPVLDPTTCDVISGTTSFNGDDRLLLYVNADDVPAAGESERRIDAFGQTAVRPASAPWQNLTLVRCNPSAYLGIDAFDVSAYYAARPLDSFGNLGVAPSAVSCLVGNEPPVAGVRGNVEVPIGTMVPLGGDLAYDPDGVVVAWSWLLLDAPAGSAAELDGADLADATFTPDVEGVYTLVLTVTDDAGDTDTDTFTITASGPASACLRISEYVEGSNSNKYIEIHNCGGSTDLASYGLCLYSNGASTCSSSLALTGSLAAGDTLVLCHSAAVLALPAGTACDVTTTGVLSFNGDDRLALYRILDGTTAYNADGDELLDAFGELTVQPASALWENRGFRRCNADPYLGVGAFDVAAYFAPTELDDVSHLGIAPVLTGCD